MINKISSLQNILEQQGLDGFIVPRSDRYQGEYVVPADERLAWLTGFTGSAGLALVFKDHVALFVDSRYTLQAAHQINPDQVEIVPIADCTPLMYMKRKLTEKPLSIGFDPWLLSDKDFSKWKTLPSLNLVECSPNLIDSLWVDQPGRPLEPIVRHDLEYAGDSHETKIARLYDSLEENGVDATIIMAPDNVCWLLNCRGSDFPYTPLVDWFGIVMKGEGVIVFCDPQKVQPQIKLTLQKHVSFRPLSELEESLSKIRDLKIMMDPEVTPVAISAKLGTHAVRVADPLTLFKACKSERELEGFRQAHLRDGVALTKFFCWLDSIPENVETEVTIADKLREFRAESDLYKGDSFPTIAGFADHGAIVHYRADSLSAKLINASSLLLIDSGAQYLDGTTDVTRTVCLGEPTQEQKTNFTLVLKGHIALAMTLFPEKTTGSQLDVLARHALWQYGLDYGHGTGHGVGYYLNVHEGPQRISPVSNSVALKPGMVISNEPGYYKAGQYGIRIESLIAVHKANEDSEIPLLCFETLTLAPIDHRLIDETLLTSAEWQWLTDYHAKVRETLLPYLEPETASWLINVTA